MFLEASGELEMKGWQAFPLPPGRKGPPPKGVTGTNGSHKDLEKYNKKSCKTLYYEVVEDSNVGIRLPENVIGLDFDLYRRSEAFLSLQKQFGKLPPTWGITNRSEPTSQGFTAFYEIPTGKSWRGGYPGLDIIHHSLRYSVAPPSIHPSGRAYRWVHVPSMFTVAAPDVDILPELPEGWVEFLSARENKKLPIGVDRAFEVRERDMQAMCEEMRRAFGRGLSSLRRTRGSRHETGVKVSWNLVQLRSRGHSGYDAARRAFIASFAKIVAPERGELLAVQEARELFSSAENKISLRQSSCFCEKGGVNNEDWKQKTTRKTSRALFR